MWLRWNAPKRYGKVGFSKGSTSSDSTKDKEKVTEPNILRGCGTLNVSNVWGMSILLLNVRTNRNMRNWLVVMRLKLKLRMG